MNGFCKCNEVGLLRRIINRCHERTPAQRHVCELTEWLSRASDCECVFYALVALSRCLEHFSIRTNYLSAHPHMLHVLLAMANESLYPRIAHAACDCIVLCAMHPIECGGAEMDHRILGCMYNHFVKAFNSDVRVQTMWALCVFGKASSERASMLVETCGSVERLNAICDELRVPRITSNARQIILLHCAQ